MARQTAAERQAEARDNFLSEAKENFEHLTTTFFLGQGYFVLVDKIDQLDAPAAAAIKKPVERYLSARRLVDDGANLTDKRKVEMLEAIYEIETIVAATPKTHPILSLYHQLTSKRTRRVTYVALAVVCGLIAIAAVPALAGVLVFAGLVYRESKGIDAIRGSIRAKAIQVVSPI